MLLGNLLFCYPGQDITLDRLYEDPPLDGVSLREIQWSEDGSRVGYLRPSTDDRDVLELWTCDSRDRLSHLLIRALDVITEESQELSDEEIQVLERKRITQRGITSYSWSPDGFSVLFPLGGSLYVHDLTTGKTVRLDDGGGGPLLDSRFSPDGSFVSFVRGGEIWITPAGGGDQRQLTRGASGTIRHGLAEFVAQEEMDRFEGYWWSPDNKRIVYLEVDESDVEVWQRASYRSGGASLNQQRYPSAGKPNARVRVGILDLSSGKTRWISLGSEIEYIARVNWGPGGLFLALQVQPRDQSWLRLIRADPRTGKTDTILEERSNTFVNLHDDLHFLADGRFIWSSEMSGLRQLYLHDSDGKRIGRITNTDLPVKELEGVNEETGLVLFSAVTDRSLEMHLFRVSLNGGKSTRLTGVPGWHDLEVSPDCRYYVDVQSSLLSPSRVTFHDSSGGELAVLEDNPTPELDLVVKARPEFLEITAADGKTKLNAVMTKPPDFDPSRKYPVVIYGYGGPHGHVVANRWRRSALWNQYLAQNGYIVFSVDPRGSFFRGKSFEDEIYKRLGVTEVEDHAEAVRYLRSLPFVDGEHIGIWGWSYGGTLAIMSLLETGGLYRCGIAVAPVTDWHWYDSHYTERYLGLPEQNEAVYSAASPNERDASGITENLLLVHGMADDNVFLRHSLSLAENLQRAGVQFDMMLYPGKTHLIAGKETKRHLYGMMFDFLEKNLKDEVTQKSTADP